MEEIIFIKKFPCTDGINRITIELPTGYNKSGDVIYTFTDTTIIVAQKCYTSKEKSKEDKEITKQVMATLLR